MSHEYRRAVEGLARETTLNPASARRIEDELLQAITSHEIAHREIAQLPPSAFARMRYDAPPKPWPRRLGGRSWLGIAAAVLLLAGALFVWEMNRSVTLPGRASVGPQNDGSTPTAAVVTEKIGQRGASQDTVPDTPRRRPAKNASRTANVIRPSGFVELPWSAGLPAFESGEIVRMEVPVATLPTYGIDISSGVSGKPVEADVLIGQDGFARAIRLVTSTARSTQ